MARAKLNQQEWETFLGLADRLEIDVRDLLKREVPFHVLEAAGHAPDGQSRKRRRSG